MTHAQPQRLSVQIFAGGGPLPTAVGGTQRRWPGRHGIVVRLIDRDGQSGLGEASPLPGLSRESLQGCAETLAHSAVWLPQAPSSADDALSALADLADRADLAARPAAQFAIESALLDLWARQRGVSVAVLLGGARPYRRVACNALCAAVADGLGAVARGVRTLKIKVGGPDFAAEQALLQTLRRALGPDVALRLDANGAWTVPQARQHLAQLVDVAPQYVEQPVPPGQMAALGPVPVPVAADESLLHTPEWDAAERAMLLDPARCAAWVIKPALMGLRAAYRLALQAQAHGVGVVITHAFDGPVGLAAACELALALPNPPWACGLDRHAGLAAWPAVDLPQPSPVGTAAAEICASDSVGLGIDAADALCAALSPYPTSAEGPDAAPHAP